MCGRYYVDDETTREIEQIVRQIERNQRQMSSKITENITAGDIHPGDTAPVLINTAGVIHCGWQRWGFRWQQGHHTQGNQLIFNARSESALEKPMFKDSVRQRRIVIPAAGFYEWNRQKEKNTFCRKDAPVLFMAGFCRRYEDGDHFVILTTAANASMEPVHDRMPLILEREQLAEWMCDDARTEQFLTQVPCLLDRKSDYEQMSLFEI